jgi:hypothetical protein
MAIEYGSSPVDAALHQTRQFVPAGLEFSKFAKTSKWWFSRKKEVKLVVNALTNSCHSGLSVDSNQPK